MANRNFSPKGEKLAEYARNGDVAGVLRMIRGNADVNAKVGPAGFTPLIEAVVSGDKEVAQILIRNGASVNLKNKYGETALHWTDDNEMIEFLIREGAEVNVKDCLGHTPLFGVMLRATTGHAEYFGGYTEAIELLLDMGANDRKVRVTENEAVLFDKDGYTGHVTVVQYTRNKKG